MTPLMVLAGVGVLAISAAGIFITLVIGIRRGDRRHLANAPQSNSDAFAKRILVGVRYPSETTEEDK